MSLSVRALSAAAAAVLLATTGVAAATPATGAPSTMSTKTYKACADKKTGAIRLLGKGKKCKRSESRLTWNAKGPIGPPGPTGAAGANGGTGPVGARGPSNAFVAAQAGMATVNSATAVTIAAVSLPPGRYVLASSVQVQNAGNVFNAGARCAIYQDATAVSAFNVANMVVTGGSGPSVNLLVFTLSPAAWIDTTAPVTAALKCDAINGSYFALNGTLTAIQVETLSTS